MNKKRNLKASVLSGLFWQFAESACGDIISFVVSVLLARMLLPADYGEVSLVNVFIVIANVFVVNGLGTALVQKKNADDLDFSSVFYVNLVFSIFLYLIIWLLSPLIADFYNIPHLSIVLRVLAIKIPIAAVNSIQNAYVSRKMIFKKFFFASLGGTLISAVIGIGMAYMGLGVWALVAQILSNSAIDTLMLWFTVKWRPKFIFSFTRLKSLVNYGWKILVSSLIKVGYDQLSNLVIGKLYTSEDLAFYSRGKKYPDLVVTDINSSISSVLFPAIAKHQDNLEKIKTMTRRSIKTSTYIMTPLLFGMIALAEPLVSWMLTDKWLPCVPYMRICCVYYMMQPIQTANLQAIRAIGRSDIILKLDIIKRGSGLLFLLLLMKQGVMGVAIAPIGMTLVATAVNIRPNKKFIKYTYSEQFLDLIPNLLMSLFMAVIVWSLAKVMQAAQVTDFIILFVGFIVGVVFYILLSFIMRNETFYYIINTFKEYSHKKNAISE